MLAKKVHLPFGDSKNYAKRLLISKAKITGMKINFDTEHSEEDSADVLIKIFTISQSFPHVMKSYIFNRKKIMDIN